MKHKPTLYCVQNMIDDYDAPNDYLERLTFDFAIQRPAGQWNNADKSLLIHSILADIIIPEVFIVQNGDGFMPKTVLDGRQRMTTVYEFVNNRFKLSKNTPDVVVRRIVTDEDGNKRVEEEIIEVGGKTFNRLADILQRKILRYEFSVRLIIEATKKELEDQMYRLNNGKSQSAAQKAIMLLGLDLGAAIEEVSVNDFIYDRLCFTSYQRKSNESLRIVLNSLTVLNGYKYKKLSSSLDMGKVAELMRKEGWNQSQLDYCKDLFQLLHKLLPSDEDIKFDSSILSTSNIPILMMNADKYSQLLEDGDITEKQYKDFLYYWVTEGFFKENYQKWCDKSISDKSHVDGRIQVMEDELLKFIGCIDEAKNENIEIFAEECKKETEQNLTKKLSINDEYTNTNYENKNIKNENFEEYIKMSSEIVSKETALRVLQNIDINYKVTDENIFTYIDHFNLLHKDNQKKLLDFAFDFISDFGTDFREQLPVLAKVWVSVKEQMSIRKFTLWLKEKFDISFKTAFSFNDYSEINQSNIYSVLHSNLLNFKEEILYSS